jgi:hypothetical protein
MGDESPRAGRPRAPWWPPAAGPLPRLHRLRCFSNPGPPPCTHRLLLHPLLVVLLKLLPRVALPQHLVLYQLLQLALVLLLQMLLLQLVLLLQVL